MGDRSMASGRYVMLATINIDLKGKGNKMPTGNKPGKNNK